MIEPQQFRDLMAGVCAPVTVVTTMTNGVPRGATVSSFASLSLNPPLVSVAFDRGSALLHFENQAFSEYVGGGPFQAPVVGPPVASVDGYQIHVTQTYVPFIPGAIGDAGPGSYSRFCQGEDVDLGALRTGSYAVVWTYFTPKGPVSVTGSFYNGSARGRAVRGH